MYWEKQSIISLKKAAKIFQNIEKFIDIGKCTKTISLLKTLRLRYLQKVQRISDELLADMPNNLSYILCCDWNSSPWPRVHPWKTTQSKWHVCILRARKHEATPSIATLSLGKKNKGFPAPIRNQNYFNRLELVPCPQGLFFSFSTFLRRIFLSPV